METKKKRKIKYMDYTLLLLVICLLVFGLVMLYSTSAYSATLKTGDSAYYLKKQVQAALVGFFLMFLSLKIGYKNFKKLTGLFYAVALILCVLVIFVGDEANGSSRWLNIFGFSFQPSELAKVAVILFLASNISDHPKAMRDFKNDLRLLFFVLPFFAVVAYNNLSTAIIIAGIAFIMIFVSNPNYFKFIALIGILAAVALIFLFANSYRLERIQVWLNPEDYDTGYQTLQGLYAIGSGGLFGKGLGESTQKLGFVPEAENDMIFTIICEELGLFGAICLILLYILLIWRLMTNALRAKSMFGSYLLIGIMSHLAIQVILNIAVVTNSIPNTGITLPFISYGGSAIMILIAEMGVALSVSQDANLEA